MSRGSRTALLVSLLVTVVCGGAACASSGGDKGFPGDGGATGDDASADGSQAGGDGSSAGGDGASSHDGAAGDGGKKGDGGSGSGSGGGSGSGSGSGSSSGSDGGSGSGSGGDGGMGGDGAVQQGQCTPGAYRCGSNNAVEVCNSSGTAWLYSATCTSGCSNGLCTGACTPGALRCNGTNAEQCNSAGTAWVVSQSCSATYCMAGQCARPGLDVALNTTLDGVVYVKGSVDVHAGATLSSPTGNLTIYADSILVESGGSIAASPTGQTATGQGANGYWSGNYYYYGGGGGGYATGGSYGGYGTAGGPAWGSATDSDVEQGSAGGNGASPSASNGEYGGKGGGVLRLFAGSITIAGQVTANGANGQPDLSCYGGGGGGSGGGVLIAGDSVTINGSVSAAAGAAGAASTCSNSTAGGAGGAGRVKVLWGSQHSITGTLSGTATQGLLPPLPLSSTSHPSPALVYNDGVATLAVSWTHAFPSAQGYYVLLDTNPSNPPTPTNGQFVSTDYTSFPASALAAGDNYFHVVSTDAMSNVGTVETVFHVAVNTSPPGVSSQSHPDQTAWSTNVNPYFQWTFPQGDSNVTGGYYVFDHDGLTVPDPSTGATFVPVTQKQLLISNVAAGVWVFHLVSVDSQGYRTHAAANYRVNIGMNPGSGGVLGEVVDSTSQPVSGASVTINGGLYTQTTDAMGNYNFTSIPAGTWQVSATSGSKSGSAQVTVTANNASTANLTVH